MIYNAFILGLLVQSSIAAPGNRANKQSYVLGEYRPVQAVLPYDPDDHGSCPAGTTNAQNGDCYDSHKRIAISYLHMQNSVKSNHGEYKERRKN